MAGICSETEEQLLGFSGISLKLTVFLQKTSSCSRFKDDKDDVIHCTVASNNEDERKHLKTLVSL